MNIQVNYNAETGKILGFYPDMKSYKSVPTPTINIDEATWKDCTDNPGKRIVDVTNKVIVTGTATLTFDELQSSKIFTLQSLLNKTDYQSSKHADGVITDAQYLNLNTARQAWRTAINDIEVCTTIDAVNAVAYSTDIPAVG